ncbi:hypothetical protein D6D01_04894 [Aureobasidium pullulans]|uniref:MYND-type domain-containing protein n=1 Tax=Aureobasidium pullulans TaxID=5580 RepID=A0A4V4JVK3_AURPU|nr:hypothetical protein D6D01_04894 [Aureobasidium pullulans]
MRSTKEIEKIEKWGTGLFENAADEVIVRELTRESGLAEGAGNFLFPSNVESYREKLDHGALDRMLEGRLPMDLSTENTTQDKDKMWIWPPSRCAGYRLCLLGAVMMRLGCRLRSDLRLSMEELHTIVGFSRNAEVQLRHALNVYVDGTPYNFRAKPQPIGTNSDDWATNSVWGDIGESLTMTDDTTDPLLKMMMRQILGPMLNELAHRPQHRLVCEDPFYRSSGNVWAKAMRKSNEIKDSPVNDTGDEDTSSDTREDTLLAASTSTSPSAQSKHDDLDGPPICGNCGIEETKESSLSVCKKCSKQHYCSKKCQKAHWSSHKKLCQTFAIT